MKQQGATMSSVYIPIKITILKLITAVMLAPILFFQFPVAKALASDDATIIMYHRFGESRLPSTNISLEMFDAHLATIKENGWVVLPLAEIVAKLKSGETLPDKALAITIDDAFLSVYEEAFPRLQSYGYPFTIFVATKAIDQNLKGYATWDQIREMKAAGVEIGSQSHSHPHMHQISLDEARQEMITSNARFSEELGEVPVFFAYPYGEYSLAVRDMIKDMGFEAAFGQASGVAHASIDSYEWPRFAFNENYGDTKRLTMAVEAKALPFSDMTHPSMILETNPPIIGFTVDEGIEPLNRLICFASSMGRVETIQLGRRIEIRLPQAITLPRSRINCTMPVLENGQETGRFRWLGRQFLTN